MIAAPLLLLWGAAAPAPGLQYDAAARQAYVEAALQAVYGAPASDLEQTRAYLGAMERGGCASSSERLRVECLMTAARRFCRGKKDKERCLRVADVAMINALAERSIIPDARRHELMQADKDTRAAIAREEARIHADWMLDFELAPSPPCPAAVSSCEAKRIDAFCLTAGDAYHQTWQACAGAIVWFIGSSVSTAARPVAAKGSPP